MDDYTEEFYKDFFHDMRLEADARRTFVHTAFVERMGDILLEAGELETFDAVYYEGTRGMRVDGYGGDPVEADGVLTIAIADYAATEEVGSLVRTEMERIFKRLENFVTAALHKRLHEQLEESSPGFELAELIARRKGDISRLRLLLLSNRTLSERVKGKEASEVAGLPAEYDIWDLSRVARLVESGKGREEIEIKFVEQFGEGLPCLQAHLGGASYEGYLAAIPGQVLADIYRKWGTRLLEQNVRCFLQARGKVNKGIRNTLLTDPEMFFAYNNGITATAEAVEMDCTNGQPRIVGLRDLQIVNGGQTTASIANALTRDKVDLSNVFVQMKLSVVPHERAVEVVPKISEYANSQNRVNAADFFANHPYHVRMEEFSRRIWAPARDGSFRETKWFYERARGQYQDAKSDLTPAKRRKFEEEYPRSQVFTKTDLAKFENVWEEIPHIVSKGAQHNFAHFAAEIGKRWESNSDHFNELYYRQAVARAIIFRRTERLVSEQPWYDGGYRANVVAYTIAKLAQAVRERDESVDFETVWKSQKVGEGMEEALKRIAKTAHDVIIDPAPGIRNISEWAKKQACWSRVQHANVALPDSFLRELIGKDEERQKRKAAAKDQVIDNSIEAQSQVVELGGEFWSQVRQWGSERGLITHKEDGVLKVASRIPRELPSERQCKVLMDVLSKVKEEGFQPSA